jgi:hypothetical protein
MTQRSAADALNVPKATVSYLLNRALENLRGVLKRKGYAVAPLALGKSIQALGASAPPASLKASLDAITSEYLAGGIAQSQRLAGAAGIGSKPGVNYLVPLAVVAGCLAIAFGVAFWGPWQEESPHGRQRNTLQSQSMLPELIQIRGNVNLERGGESVPVEVGTKLRAGDLLKTGANGWAVLGLADRDSRVEVSRETLLSTQNEDNGIRRLDLRTGRPFDAFLTACAAHIASSRHDFAGPCRTVNGSFSQHLQSCSPGPSVNRHDH